MFQESKDKRKIGEAFVSVHRSEGTNKRKKDVDGTARHAFHLLLSTNHTKTSQLKHSVTHSHAQPNAKIITIKTNRGGHNKRWTKKI